MPAADAPELLAQRTDELLARHARIAAAHDDRFAAARELATLLGARVVGDDDAAFGFWTPEVVEAGVPVDDVALEVLTPPGDLDPGRTRPQQVRFDRTLVPLARRGEFHWGVVTGVRPGTRETLGSLYRLVYEPADGRDGDGRTTVSDPLASSVPFGAFGPAELYDRDRLDATRADRSYFAALGTDDEPVATVDGGEGTDGGGDDGDAVPRIAPPTNVLEIHSGTATERGSLAGLTDAFERIARARRTGGDLEPWERHVAGYDAVELLPIEPVTESRERHDFWRESARRERALTATVARPQVENWGYDPVISGFSAPNPSLLETGRPDELVDFVAACHAAPRPIRVVFDVVLGHAAGRATELLPDRFFAGPGPYGRALNYADPTVRAILLELLRRKLAFGADGIRVDAAHDVRRPSRGVDGAEPPIDDAFLAAMGDVVVEVGDAAYRPWTVYEDARPCPEPDWPLTATFRGAIDRHPGAFQWSSPSATTRPRCRPTGRGTGGACARSPTAATAG